ncbi:ABC transporter substrate-binding protein [Falsiroseomonas stagni]|uniref:Peptide/nickel transport system substrate-binding protein n=1 Tax=Falsiroseomonas stagni DSM 19981 TaxID=1123062 RepID=A0A1I3XKT4_9PROT|nr:ABC transporter substrate-binding protein [Falsiroseomonas stagni]SFK20088.1 peptide/nickel transport system substrate-binding protein [Falsiroseomonas stagni DSM 19981]
MRHIALAALLALGSVPAAEARNFTWAFNADVLTLDPHSSNNTFTNTFMGNVYEALVRHNDRIEIEPALAESWERTTPTIWRFNLRRNVVFHNGESFDADDVVFTWARVNSPGSMARGLLGAIKEVRKVDSHVIEIETHRPFPILPASITQFFIMDEGWSRANNATEAANLAGQQESGATRVANGTGPFRITERRPDERTVLEPHAGWWDRPVHNLTRVTFQPIRSAATRTASLLSGAIDANVEVPLQDIPRLLQDSRVQVIEGPELRTIYLGFDHERDELLYSDVRGRNPLKDRRVREAIYRAIDVNALVRTVMREKAWPAGMMVSPFLTGAPQDLNGRLPFDPDGARRLLAEAGYPQGFTVGIVCPNDRYVNDERTCQAIAAMLARVGIRLQLQSEPTAVWSRRTANRDFSIYLLGHAGLPLADSYSTLNEVLRTAGRTTGGLNYGRWSNAAFDALVERAAEAADETARRGFIRDALAIERAEIAHVPLFQQPIAWASRRGIDLRQAPDNRLRLWLVKVE